MFHYYTQYLKMQPDIANLVCKFTVFDKYISQELSTSAILSYLVNQDMFNKINDYIKDKLKMSIYIDDMMFSSNKPISKKNKIINIIESYDYKVNPKKSNIIPKEKPKKLLG